MLFLASMLAPLSSSNFAVSALPLEAALDQGDVAAIFLDVDAGTFGDNSFTASVSPCHAASISAVLPSLSFGLNTGTLVEQQFHCIASAVAGRPDKCCLAESVLGLNVHLLQ